MNVYNIKILLFLTCCTSNSFQLLIQIYECTNKQNEKENYMFVFDWGKGSEVET